MDSSMYTNSYQQRIKVYVPRVVKVVSDASQAPTGSTERYFPPLSPEICQNVLALTASSSTAERQSVQSLSKTKGAAAHTASGSQSAVPASSSTPGKLSALAKSMRQHVPAQTKYSIIPPPALGLQPVQDTPLTDVTSILEPRFDGRPRTPPEL